MKLEDLRELDRELITFEQFEEIEEMEGVITQNNGLSGQYIGYNWYTIYYEDDNIKEEFNVFL